MLLFGGGLVVIMLYMLSVCRVCGRCCSVVVAGCGFFCCWCGNGRLCDLGGVCFWLAGRTTFPFSFPSLYDCWPVADVVGRGRLCFRWAFRVQLYCVCQAGRDCGGVDCAPPPTPYQKTFKKQNERR